MIYKLNFIANYMIRDLYCEAISDGAMISALGYASYLELISEKPNLAIPLMTLWVGNLLFRDLRNIYNTRSNRLESQIV